MTRQIYDYPELKGHIGNLRKTGDSDGALMSTDVSYNHQTGQPAGHLFYNPNHDRKGRSGEKERSEKGKFARENNLYTAGTSHSGNHELGRIQNFPAADNEDEDTFREDLETHTASSSLVNQSLEKTLSGSEFKKLKRYKKMAKPAAAKGARSIFRRASFGRRGLPQNMVRRTPASF